MRGVRILAAVAVVVLFGGGWLLGDDPPKGRVRGTLPQGWKKLGLDEDQVKQIYKVQNDYQAKIDGLEEQIRKLRTDQRRELEKVLTAAQKARLKELRDSKDKDLLPEAKPATPPPAAPADKK